jgi:hypothetical protein
MHRIQKLAQTIEEFKGACDCGHCVLCGQRAKLQEALTKWLATQDHSNQVSKDKELTREFYLMLHDLGRRGKARVALHHEDRPIADWLHSLVRPDQVRSSK